MEILLLLVVAGLAVANAKLLDLNQKVTDMAVELDALKAEVSRNTGLVAQAVELLSAEVIHPADLVAPTAELKANNDALDAAVNPAPPA
jgi:cell division protein FtsL